MYRYMGSPQRKRSTVKVLNTEKGKKQMALLILIVLSSKKSVGFFFGFRDQTNRLQKNIYVNYVRTKKYSPASSDVKHFLLFFASIQRLFSNVRLFESRIIVRTATCTQTMQPSNNQKPFLYLSELCEVQQCKSIF